MFLLPMLALATTLTVSFFVLHQTTKIAVAIPLIEDSCNITTPETNRTALLRQQVLAELNRDEPNYHEAAR